MKWKNDVALKSSNLPFFYQIIDGGSTGSRLHIFEFVEDDENDVECVRRGSSRANVPLSAFGRLPSEMDAPLDPDHVADHLVPLFEYAASVIPSKFHASTPVRYQATAGMRLLEEAEQDSVYDALYEGLMGNPKFSFRGMVRDDIATLSGELEGFYGAIAANYLQGVVDANLRFNYDYEEAHNGPVGALDMGGSSTQIVFLPGHHRNDDVGSCRSDSIEQNCGTQSSDSHLDGEKFFSTSYLSYGVDQFRERLWNTLLEDHEEENSKFIESCDSTFVQNPCANRGYEQEWNGFTLIGTGDTDECIRQTQRLIPHPKLPHDNHEDIRNKVGGVDHPPVRGKFLAMSLYFFSLDSLRVFSEPAAEAHEALNLSWPNPSIDELHQALDGLCSRDWHGDMALQKGTHDFTREEVLPHRCIETVYMVTLLKDGFGFHPSSRDITFTFLVDGSEVEWTLGMALAMNAEEVPFEDGEDQDTNIINATYDDQVEEPQNQDAVWYFPLIYADSL